MIRYKASKMDQLIAVATKILNDGSLSLNDRKRVAAARFANSEEVQNYLGEVKASFNSSPMYELLRHESPIDKPGYCDRPSFFRDLFMQVYRHHFHGKDEEHAEVRILERFGDGKN